MVPPLLVDGSPHLPFQLQIEYTGRDGSRCIRVITQAKPITTNRDVAERGRVGGYNYYMHYMYVMYTNRKQPMQLHVHVTPALPISSLIWSCGLP